MHSHKISRIIPLLALPLVLFLCVRPKGKHEEVKVRFPIERIHKKISSSVTTPIPEELNDDIFKHLDNPQVFTKENSSFKHSVFKQKEDMIISTTPNIYKNETRYNKVTKKAIKHPKTIEETVLTISNKKKMKKMPDIGVIGVKKCGTGAMIEVLRMHPNIVAPRYDQIEITFWFDQHERQKGLEYYKVIN